MKLPDHVDHIRTLINKAFDNQFSRIGLGSTKMLEIEKIPQDFHSKRKKLDVLITSHTGEFGNYKEARDKALDELTFTLFNRLAAVKVMESLHLFPPVVTKQPEHGDRSFGHKIWLEENPEMRSEELEGLRQYFKDEFNKLGETIPLYHKSYPYALLPYVIDLNEIITAFNAVELDPQIEPEIWQSDDILGWLYESYNLERRKNLKGKIEYDKVHIQSGIYTPRWVVEFLVNNSLGKLYLEMYPDSEIKNQFKIANVPETGIREIKPLHEIKMIDPASGSGNFLLYGFEFFYQLYEDQIENYGADYDEDEIPKLIIEHNLHGIDLDDRAIQLAQLGLWIKAKQKRRSINKLNFNVVSSNFYLPDFVFVEPIFKTGTTDSKQLSVIEDIWGDLQQAYKFGSLVKIEEKLNLKLHGLLDHSGNTLFGKQELDEYEIFKASFLKNLQTAVNLYAIQQGNSFLTDKTRDAITFLKLLTTKYDIATANPPYTDSADFGPHLKSFIDKNYKKPYKTNTNLYAVFLMRCVELSPENGLIAMIHPRTYMFIKKFEGLRNFILNHTHIQILADFGYSGIFDDTIRIDTVAEILKKSVKNKDQSLFIKLSGYEFTKGSNSKNKNLFLNQAIDDFNQKKQNKINYYISQEKLKEVKSWPFIYWISDDFREKFAADAFEEYFQLATGLMTGNNLKHLRFYWEISKSSISKNYPEDRKKWVPYQKGGDYNKWFGNNWLLVNYTGDGKFLSTTDNKRFYFKKGITYSATSAKGVSFRALPDNQIFDKKGSCIFELPKAGEIDLNYVLAFLNTKFTHYIVDCLNSTIETQIGDIKRVPFIKPSRLVESEISTLASTAVQIKKFLNKFNFLEKEFEISPLAKEENIDFKKAIISHLNLENYLISYILLGEALIEEKILNIYGLSESDKAIVNQQEGLNVGSLPISPIAKSAYLKEQIAFSKIPFEQLSFYLEKIPEKDFSNAEKEKVEEGFLTLFSGNNDLEGFCIRHQVNPVNVWYWFKESNAISKQRMNDLAMEFLADMLREILMEDEDGIIPLVPNAGEKVLLDRVEEKFMEKGFSRAQYSSFDSVLGRDINEYINIYFFKEFSDHLNLFMYLPKTPFIWHLSSGPEKAFDCYIIIYKWSRDKLLRIRSVYIENRERSLVNRQSDLSRDDSAKAQNEKETIYKQLKELEVFKKKIDELLQEGYDPILDDGVGKNIAPLQAKGMLPYEVLNKGQLDKYLNADW